MSSQLALLGGPKTVTREKPQYIWPIITKETEDAVVKQLYTEVSIYNRSGIIEEFENKFSTLHSRKYGLLTSSGTAAIHTLFVAANLHRGDEVICPAYTFFATATPILQTGAVPILCEADPENGNIDPQEIERLITSKTKAVIVTHMWGRACEMDKIKEICDKHNLILLEDCSHAHGGVYKGKKLGSWGHAAAWSLQGQKVVTGGEGGIVLTDDVEMYYKGLLLGHYNKRCKQEIPKEHPLSKYSVTGMGLKLRSHPLAVAIASQQLDHLEEWTKQKNEYARYLTERLSKLKGVHVPEMRNGEVPAWYAYVFRYIPEEIEDLPVEKFMAAIQAEGCYEADTTGSTCPLNILPLFQEPEGLFPEYKGIFSYKPGDFPKAEKFFHTAIKLPVWVTSDDEEIVRQYADAIEKVIKNYRDLLV